jgi:hypothetical protein
VFEPGNSGAIGPPFGKVDSKCLDAGYYKLGLR